MALRCDVRIVSLLPSATEVVFALGAGDDVAGVTFECDFPPEARTRRIISTSTLPEGLAPVDIDRLVSERLAAGEDLYRLEEGALAELDPDLVLTQDLCAVCAVDVSVVDDALRYLGCSANVLTLDPQNLEEVLRSIHLVGGAVGRESAAAALVSDLRRRLAVVASAVAALPQVPVLVLEWTDPPFAPGHWIPDMVSAAGGHNVLGGSGAKSVRVTWDAVSETRPAVVVAAPCGFDLAGAVKLTKQLVNDGKLPRGVPAWAVDANASFARPGPRLVDGVEALAAVLHPDVGLSLDEALAYRVA